MTIELITLSDGGILVLTDQEFENAVKRVEFFTDTRLMMVIHGDQEDLMDYEVPHDFVDAITSASDVMIFTVLDDRVPEGYSVPLIRIGE